MELVVIGLFVWAFVVCWQKDKQGFAILGIFSGIFVIVGAFRIAKPGSTWDKKHYPVGSGKYKLARERFGG